MRAKWINLPAAALCSMAVVVVTPAAFAADNELVARYQRKTPKPPTVDTSSTTISGVTVEVSGKRGSLEASVAPEGPVPREVEEKWNTCRQLLSRIAVRSAAMAFDGKSSDKALFNDKANMEALQDFLDEGCQDLLGADAGFDTAKEIAREVADKG
ncbi:MAG: hypothetical protein AAFN94_05725 [Pseudomonadota bacterium]